MTAAERKIVDKAEKAKRAADADRAKADTIIRPIYERCTKRMQRHKSSPCKQGENNGAGEGSARDIGKTL